MHGHYIKTIKNFTKKYQEDLRKRKDIEWSLDWKNNEHFKELDYSLMNL